MKSYYIAGTGYTFLHFVQLSQVHITIEPMYDNLIIIFRIEIGFQNRVRIGRYFLRVISVFTK